jgi:hypothetical protein
MSALPNPFNLVAHEQNCLAAMAADARQIRARLESFGARPDHSAKEIGALIRELNGWSNRLQFHNAPASYLYQMGRPGAWQEFSRLLTDLQGAIKVYGEMYQGRLQVQQNILDMQQKTQQEWTQTVQTTVDANRDTANRQFKKWNAFFTRSCATCGYSLGDWYHKLELCPNCGMLLRK